MILSTSFACPTENSLRLINFKILFENYTFHTKDLYIISPNIVFKIKRNSIVIGSTIIAHRQTLN